MIDKILGYIIRIPIYLILILGTPIIFIVALGVTLSFEESIDAIKEVFSF